MKYQVWLEIEDEDGMEAALPLSAGECDTFALAQTLRDRCLNQMPIRTDRYWCVFCSGADPALMHPMGIFFDQDVARAWAGPGEAVVQLIKWLQIYKGE